jgi:hypothetical protein
MRNRPISPNLSVSPPLRAARVKPEPAQAGLGDNNTATVIGDGLRPAVMAGITKRYPAPP